MFVETWLILNIRRGLRTKSKVHTEMIDFWIRNTVINNL
jgi:hypothetical protein